MANGRGAYSLRINQPPAWPQTLLSNRSPRRCVWGLSLAVITAVLVLSNSAPAQSPGMEGRSDDRAREQAKRAIPWNQLSKQERRTTQYIVRNASLFRRLPTKVIDCDAEVFNLLLDRPEVVANVWQLMGVSKLELTPVNNTTYRATDHVGGSGTLRIFHREQGEGALNRMVIYGEGVYDQKPLPRAFKAKCLMVLNSASHVETNGRNYVTARMDTFVTFDRLGAELVAKTVGPLLFKAADHNFSETMKFAATFSRTAEHNPAGMKRMASQLETVSPQVQQEVSTTCQAAAERYADLLVNRKAEKIRLTQLQSDAVNE